MDVTVVGVGCKRCDELVANTRKALDALGLTDVTIRRVQEEDQIADLGVILTPVLVVNNMCLTSGKVPTAAQLERHLKAVATMGGS
jgi:hypothetical protein